MHNQPTYPADLKEPIMYEISMWQIQTQDFDYDISWIKGELMLRVNCRDGFVIVVYNKKDKKNE